MTSVTEIGNNTYEGHIVTIYGLGGPADTQPRTPSERSLAILNPAVKVVNVHPGIPTGTLMWRIIKCLRFAWDPLVKAWQTTRS
jgi:hypothetical protein